MLLGRKSLGDILQSFDKTLNDLADLKNRNASQVAVNEARVAVLQAESHSLTTEADQAMRVHANLSELLAK